MKKPPSSSTGRRWLLFRRISQFLFFLIFLVLFLRTDYNGTDSLDGAVNLIFRLDPYVAACVMLAARSIIGLLLPSLLLVVLSLLFGRLFCGWACPMGGLLDLARRCGIRSRRVGNNKTPAPRLARKLLLVSLVAAFLGFPLVGYLDPFSLLVRGMTQAIYPLFHSVSTEFFTFTYQSLPGFVNSVTEPVYALMRETILPAEQKYFSQVYLAFILLAAVVGAEMVHPRFFCRNLCPLGSLFGLCSRWSFLKGAGGDEACGTCRLCSRICRMGAIDENRQIAMDHCSFCNECVVRCPRQVISFQLSVGSADQSGVSFSRREFLAGLGGGILLPLLRSTTSLAARPQSVLVRPPGALEEREFLARCVRCGECLQVCITNGLQPAFLESGWAGIFSPYLVSRLGYCEYNCSLCGQVCPTGAIENLPLPRKQQVRIGLAIFDRNRCLPYAKGIPCMVCEEHCPVPDKAIRFTEVKQHGPNGETTMVKQPWVVDELCIGCGICENRCPLDGPSAIIVHPGQPVLSQMGSGSPYS